MLRSKRTLMLALLFMMSGLLYAASQSDDMILEDSNLDMAKKMKKYGGSDAVVNSIQRDPFYRLLEGLNDKEHSITDYELGEFTLLGTVWDVSKPIGMFKGPKDRRYVVRVGDRIGKNNGVVVDIDKGEVFVKEVFTDLNGSKIEKSTIKRVEKPV